MTEALSLDWASPTLDKDPRYHKCTKFGLFWELNARLGIWGLLLDGTGIPASEYFDHKFDLDKGAET